MQHRLRAAINATQIVGMRNIVVHVYWGIAVAELVKTVQTDLPALITSLKSALERMTPTDPPPP